MKYKVGDKVRVKAFCFEFDAIIRGYSDLWNEYVIDYNHDVFKASDVQPIILNHELKRDLVNQDSYDLDPNLKDDEEVLFAMANEIIGFTISEMVADNWIQEDKICRCVICKYGDEYSTPNLGNGQFICYSCKSSYSWKLYKFGGYVGN